MIQMIKSYSNQIQYILQLSLLSIKSKPLILTYQQPSPCQLAIKSSPTMFDNSARFGVEALCVETNSIPIIRQHLEDVFYQQHSSQTIIDNYARFSAARRRLFINNENIDYKINDIPPFSAAIPSVDSTKRRLQYSTNPGLEGCNCAAGLGSCPSRAQYLASDTLVPTVISAPAPEVIPQVIQSELENGLKVTQICNTTETNLLSSDIIFPCMQQCIAIDSYEKRIFSVGGELNGEALNRLKVYLIKSKTAVKEINIDLELDKPLYGSMCQYYNHTNGREYIIVINGMSNVNDINNNNLWYNDIVFIPLDPSENRNMIYE